MTTFNSPPRTPRDVLGLFRYYRSDPGLDGIIMDVDFRDVPPRQIYHAVHGRAPETLVAATADERNEVAEIFRAALCSEEFRDNIPRFVLSSFPNKKRLFFIHIPKCAGSNLSAHLSARFPCLNTSLFEEGIPHTDIFRSIKECVLEILSSDTIYVCGHNHISTYENWNLQFDDQLFTVLRDPRSLIISQINYVLTRIFSEEEPIARDTSGWRHEFEIGDPVRIPVGPELIDLASRILNNRGVVPADVMAKYLGGGLYETALTKIVSHNIEITNMENYGKWCKERWGIERETRLNESVKYIGWEDMPGRDRDLVDEITAEDRCLYDAVGDRLASLGKSSVVGREVLDKKDGVQVMVPAASKTTDNGATSFVVPISGAAPNAAPSAEGEAQRHRDLMLGFESLGENCEFGLVQRRCGSEPLGLFRFASAPLPKLKAGLVARFEGFAEAGNLDVQLSENGREFMVEDRRFGFLYHAWVLLGEMTPEQIRDREVKRLPLLIRKLTEDLEEGEKIFVFHGMEPLSEEEGADLAAILRSYGPATLLWVELADEAHPPGSVERVSPALLKGYMDRFAPGENAHDLSLDCWISVCCEAVALHRQADATTPADFDVAARQQRPVKGRASRSARPR